MPQPRVVEQHHAAGDVIGALVVPLAGHRHDCLALHVTGEQFVHVTDGEDVRIDDHRAAAVAHVLRWVETQGGEALQVVVAPGPPAAGAQELTALVSFEERKFFAAQDVDLETLGFAGLAPQGMARDARAEQLAIVGMDVDPVVQRRCPLAAFVGGPSRAAQATMSS